MKGKGSRNKNDKEIASADEVRSVIRALTPEELRKLDKYARWRIKGLGRASMDRTHEDLLQEAIMLTLDGNRHWNKGAVDFVKHLREAMRSISTGWRRKFDPDEAHLESQVIEVTPQGRLRNPLSKVRSLELDPEQAMAIKEELEWVERLVADDPIASLIIEGLRESMTGPEIQDVLSISKTEYETKMKWIYRTVRRTVALGRKTCLRNNETMKKNSPT